MEFNNQKELNNYHIHNYDLWKNNIIILKEFANQPVQLYPTNDASMTGRVYIALPKSEATKKNKYNLL
jgi:hypothetical protein